MTYIAKESGALTGEPIELYEFEFPNEVIHRYTTSAQDYFALNENWKAASLKRSTIKATGNKGVAPILITCPLDFLPSILFNEFATSRISIKVYRTHRGDAEVFFHGKWFMSSVNFTSTNSIITGTGISSLLQTELPRFFYQFQCNHELYSAECGVIPQFNTGTITAEDVNDKRLLTLSAIAPSIAVLGVITVGLENRLVRLTNGTTSITILEPFINLQVGDSYSMHTKGCDRSFLDCKTLHSNGNNFGGMPYIPVRNIFAGGFQ